MGVHGGLGGDETDAALTSALRALEDMEEELRAALDDAASSRAELERVRALVTRLFAALSQGVVVLDAGSRVVIWDDRVERLLGVSAGDAVGRRLAELPGSLLAALTDAVDRCVGAGGGEARLRHRGLLLRLLCSALPAGGGGGTVVLVDEV